jgi:hypothetical protein
MIFVDEIAKIIAKMLAEMMFIEKFSIISL